MVGEPGGRALFVISSARRRGAEIQASQLASRLAEHGWQIDVTALHAGTDGIRLDVAVLGRRRLGPTTLSELRRRARGYDVVVAYGSTALPACAMALSGTSVPFVYRSISDPAHWLRGRLHRGRTRLLYRRAAHVVALWPGAAQRLTDVLGVDPDLVTVIPNARDPDVFRPPTSSQRAEARRDLALGDEPVVAFIGAASPEKRFDRAIEVVERLPSHVLLVAGGGPDLAADQRLARAKLGDRVVFVGEVDDVRPILHASDVVLITSDVEGMPGVAIEAGLCGVPVVATPVGAVESMEFVHVGSLDVDDLADHVARAPGNERASADAYAWPRVVPLWLELLDRFRRPRSMGGRESGRNDTPEWSR